MQIVIEIPLGDYEWIKNHVMTVNEQMIANGKLLSEVLDEIKKEIQALPKTYPFINHIDTYVKEDDVVDIIQKRMGVNDENSN